MSLIFKTVDGYRDLSRYDHTVTPAGNTIVGTRMEFPGANGDFVKFADIGITNGQNGTGEFTFVAWFKVDVVDAVARDIIYTSNEFYWRLYSFSGNCYFVAYDGTLREVNAGAISIGKWQFAVGTYSSVDGMKSYLNGVPGASNVWTGTANSQAFGFNGVGSRGDGLSPLNGLVNEAAVYDHAWTEDDVKRVYQRDRIFV